jgi:GNAT superfamily N-acetyltransferase
MEYSRSRDMSHRSVGTPLYVSVPVSLRSVGPDDEAFLFDLYASTREEELALIAWGAAVKTAFLRQQFHAQQAHYRGTYPNAMHQVILHDDRPIGRVYVARSAQETHLIDIALLPGWRGRGIGTALIRDLLREADQAGIPVRLHVFLGNHQARRLYERLGFAPIGGADLHILMERCPGSTPLMGGNS